MTSFTTLRSPAVPLPGDDIDTDVIFPARFLLLTQKAGLGRYAFHDLRADPAFVLNQPRWQGASILVAGANFGCGSSREQAPWALADLGLRCIVALGFGEIFRANCINNGVLPVTLAAAPHAAVMNAARSGEAIDVDLANQRITLPDGHAVAFDLPARDRQALLQGLDTIARILADDAAAIAAFEARQRQTRPWLHDT